MGGGKKLEFTAIGDSINTTSRLEGANKFFSTNILVGENTKELLKDQYDLNYIGKFSLKGKDIPYGIYYYCEGENEIKEKFSEMLKAYESKDLATFKKYQDHFNTNNIDFGPVTPTAVSSIEDTTSDWSGIDSVADKFVFGVHKWGRLDRKVTK